MKKNKEEINADMAAAILQQEQQRRVKDCSEKIQKALEEYKCTLDAAIILKQGQVIPNVSVVAL